MVVCVCLQVFRLCSLFCSSLSPFLSKPFCLLVYLVDVLRNTIHFLWRSNLWAGHANGLCSAVVCIKVASGNPPAHIELQIND
jgi:hypothetical protein